MAPSLEVGTAAGPRGWGGTGCRARTRVVEGSWQLPPRAATRIILGGFLAWFLPGPQATASCPQWEQAVEAGCWKYGRCPCSVRHPLKGAPEGQGLGHLEGSQGRESSGPRKGPVYATTLVAPHHADPDCGEGES